MTLETQDPRVVITGNGTRGPYSLVDATSQAIRFMSTSHVRLVRYSSTTDEVGDTLVQDTDYTVGGTQDARTFTLTSAQDVLTSSQRIVADRNQTYVQDLSLSNGGSFGAVALMNRLDKYGEYLQELKAKVDRKLEASPLDSTPSTFPLKANAGSGDILAFDSDKNLYPASLSDLVTSVVGALDGVISFSTYAEMTAAEGLIDNAIYITYGRVAEEDGGFGFWRYDSGSSTGANGGTVLAVDGGGVGRFFRQYDASEVNVAWFGSLSGSAFGATLAAAITAAGIYGTINVPYGAYTLTTMQTPLTGQIIRGVGRRPVITKGANIDMFDMSAILCSMENIDLRGAGATYTGRGIIIGTTGQNYQTLDSVWIYGMNGYCLEFTDDDAGSNFRAHHCNFQRQTTTNPAIGLPTTTETGGNRRFIDCSADGGWLLKFNAGINTWLIGCDFVNLDFSNSDGVSLRAAIMGCRIATTGADFAIYGNDSVIEGNVIAGNVTINGAASRNRVGPNALIAAGTITDNSTATGTNVNEIWASYDLPSIPWRADTVNPAIGDGALPCAVERRGRKLAWEITMSAGASTTFGTDAWYFEPPSPFSTWVAKRTAIGSIYILDTGTKHFVGTCKIASGAKKIYLFPHDSGNNIKSDTPMVWASGDQLSLSIEYEIA